ncbi:hypothetical protein FGIG_12189 [Fasciola gigantica]|uniref:Voltage-dependent calcium channel alpha-2/delta subunit conserved region domain-containing protein n=1 Tax=Fasciola gigantica TaxID=46835 RepID=A0A504YYA5_FASGI|nr:hypothetical protein FGIG_12189 [Fasciola gigantica]
MGAAKTTSVASRLLPSSIRFCNQLILLGFSASWLYKQDAELGTLTRTFAFGVLLPFVVADRASTGKANQEPYSCVQLTRRYFATHNSIYSEHAKDAGKVFGGSINCSETCSRDWSVQNVIGTNLQLLVADLACETCNHWDEEVPRGPVEDTGPDVCEEALHPKYRRQQDRCPAEVHAHTIQTCSSPGLMKSLLTLFVSILFVFSHIVTA